ncbi:hypothetical protein B0O80DRAFT_303399 [Mortierella sp. GBAus27b]|nr:hypothetical protein B0O80DRAFT_303399 [Mortierella sp. GBAus27b]
MERAVDRSQDLRQLTLVFKELHKEYYQETFEQLIHRYGKKLTGLALPSDSTELWMPKDTALCSTRTVLPELEEIGMSSDLEGQLLLDCVQWIAEMVSGSSQPPSTFLCSSSLQSNIASRSPGRNKGPLRLLDLNGVPPQHHG